MSKNTKIVIAILAVGALFVLLLGYWAATRRAGQTAAAIATVVDARLEKVRRRKNKTILTLAYRANGTPAQGRARIAGAVAPDYPAGRKVRICYDPADPTSLRASDDPCG